MKTEYKRDLKNNYLVIEANPEINIEEYIVHMTEQNIISGLLPMQIRKMDGCCYLYYEITSRQPMESMYEKKVLSYQDILHILSKVQEVLESVRKYLLNPQQILFDPKYMYVNAENTEILFCYFPAGEKSFSVSVLAEYILKKLDHEDTKAVSLGYSFYQHATEENFSLSETLHEILEVDWKDNKKRESASMSQKEEKENPAKYSYPSQYESGEKKENKANQEEWKEYEVFHKDRKYQKERQKEYQKKRDRWVDRLFRMIHPGILIGTLLAMAGLEGLLYYGWINLTEAGGCMFLILSVSILGNRFWRKKKDETENDYGVNLEKEEDDFIKENMKEDMEALRAELYQSSSKQDSVYLNCYSGVQKTYSEDDKTEYLSESGTEIAELMLVSEYPEKYPLIRLLNKVLIVGKTKGQADILLQAAAVSRIHARLEQRQGSYYVRDLNSKNGTYVNGVRLKPQEEVEIREGDSIIFANIRYFASAGAGDADRTQLLRN